MSGIILTNEFEGRPLTCVEYRGRPCWLASQVSLAMGYSRGDRLVSVIGSEWKNEFIEGVDFYIVEGAELADLKDVLKPHTNIVCGSVCGSIKYASHLMLLFESGLNLACVKTDKPLGKKLRRFIVDEVMPQVLRDGKYDPARQVVEGEIKEAPQPVDDDVARMREKRLLMKERYRIGRELIGTLRKCDFHPAGLIHDLEMSIFEEALSRSLSAFKQSKQQGFVAVTVLANRLGVSTQKLGQVISKLGIRGDAQYCIPATSKVNDGKKEVVTWKYNKDGVELIEEEIKREGSSQLSLALGGAQ